MIYELDSAILDYMKDKVYRMRIKGIALDKDTELPIVLLQSEDLKQVLPLPIGPFEASAIIIEIEGVRPPRPLTHDLLSQFFKKHNFNIKRLEIYEAIDDNFLARIYYGKGFRNYKMEVRPSDGIAIAIREEAPIYVFQNVLEISNDHRWYVSEDKEAVPEIIFLNSVSETPIM